MLPHLKDQIAQAARAITDPNDRWADVKKYLGTQELENPKKAEAFAAALLADKAYLAGEWGALVTKEKDPVQYVSYASAMAQAAARVQQKFKLSEEDSQAVYAALEQVPPKAGPAPEKVPATSKQR